MRRPKVNGGTLAHARPERVGLSAERLGRIGAWLQSLVDAGRVPGAVALVARRGRIAYETAIGRRDPAQPDPMRRDTVFRIQSMTKPILSVALMQLHEQGRFTLADPIAQYCPALAKMRVAVPRGGGGDADFDLVPAARDITIHDLLRHTSGFTYGLRTTHVKALYEAFDKGRLEMNNEELIAGLGQLPLVHQPGTHWEYGYSSEVLGYLVEVLSDRTLGQYLSEHIFKPLGMGDTGFWLRKDQLSRMAEPGAHPDTGEAQPMQDHRTVRRLERGGGGLVSTVPDYLRFAQMLLNGGELDGARLIGPKTLAWMTADHLGDRPRSDFYPGPGYGFGLGFAVRHASGSAIVPGSAGDYNWFGWGGTTFWVDPAEELIGLAMIQSPAINLEFLRRFRGTVYQAIVD